MVFSPNAHFLVGEIPAPPALRRSWWEGTGLSIAVHACLLAVVIYGASHARQVVQTASSVTDELKYVFLDRPGPGGGGGGGGEPTPTTPPRRAEIVRTAPRELTPTTNPADIPQKPDIHVPVATVNAVETLPGAITALDGVLSGPGTGPGGGGGRGPGSGPGDGAGVGPGQVAGMGGDLYQPGADVVSPQLIREVKPQYTADAMRARIQGVVAMDAVVLSNGTVDPSRIRITRSLDAVMGLDQQAVMALKEWRFKPGTYKGRPVAMRVYVELTFTLR
jgi:periplasmic protein TonB